MRRKRELKFGEYLRNEILLGLWLENGVNHLEILGSSRGVRNIACLGDSDELVITTDETAIQWSSENKVSCPLNISFCWRERLDDTKG